MRKRTTGFTLIELMIVVAIIGVLAAIGIANYNHLTRKTAEATTKGNLGTIRSSLAIYYGDNEGMYPTDDLTSITNNSRYLLTMPPTRTQPYHSEFTTVTPETTPSETGGWSYDNSDADPAWGVIHVGCFHQDLLGQAWSVY